MKECPLCGMPFRQDQATMMIFGKMKAHETCPLRKFEIWRGREMLAVYQAQSTEVAEAWAAIEFGKECYAQSLEGI